MSKQYFDKLNTEKLVELAKVELAKAEKLKLSLVGDAEKLVGTANDAIKEYLSAIENTEDEADKVVQQIFEVEAAREQVFDFGSDLLGLQKDINTAMKGLEKSADDLGMNADDIPVWNDLDLKLEDIKEAFDAEDRLKQANDLIKAL